MGLEEIVGPLAKWSIVGILSGGLYYLLKNTFVNMYLRKGDLYKDALPYLKLLPYLRLIGGSAAGTFGVLVLINTDNLEYMLTALAGYLAGGFITNKYYSTWFPP